MPDRRSFLSRTAGTLGALALAPSAWAAAPAWAHTSRLGAMLDRLGQPAPARLADDEAFWAEVRTGFDLDPTLINLDHGWTNPAPRAAVDDAVQGLRRLEALPSEALATLWPTVTDTTVRAAIAEAMGVPGDQLALVRNATEALDTVLLGVPLAPGTRSSARRTTTTRCSTRWSSASAATASC